MVYEDIYDAKNAVDHLSGFNVCGRYIIVLYHRPEKQINAKPVDMKAKAAELERLKEKYGVDAEEQKPRQPKERT